MKANKWEILSHIKQYISEKTPGYLHLLDIIARRKTGKSTIELLLENPAALYEVLEEYYGDKSTVIFILSSMFLKPLAIKLGNPALVDTLLNAVINKNNNEFFKILKENGLEIK